MRIALVNEHFPPFAPGGAEWSTHYLAQKLAEDGHEVFMLTPNYGATPLEKMGRLTVIRYPYPYKMKPGQQVASFFWLANPIMYLYSAIQLQKLIKEHQLDLLHVQHKYALVGSWLAARWQRIPVLITLRDVGSICASGLCMHQLSPPPKNCGMGHFWWGGCRRQFVQRYLPTNTLKAKIRSHLISMWDGLDLGLRRFFLARADAVVSISQGLLDTYQAAGVKLPSRQMVIYNLPPSQTMMAGDDTVDLDLDLADKKVVLYTGKLSPGKGTPVLLEAAKMILAQRPNIVFVLVGKGNQPTDLPPGIITPGAQPHATVLKLYQRADVVVLPSIVPEGSGRTLLEAMTVGKPVIGTNIGGIPELIEDGVNGRLVERGDSQALADALLDILDDEPKRKTMGQASLNLLQRRYNPDTITDKLTNLYKRLVTG